MNIKKSIDVLNKLILINDDRIKKYESAIKSTDHKELKELFRQFINSSKHCKLELLCEVDHLGGKEAVNSSLNPDPVKHKTILDLIEMYEDATLEAYNTVLTHDIDFLTIEQHKMIYKQYMLIKEEHEKARVFRDTLMEHY